MTEAPRTPEENDEPTRKTGRSGAVVVVGPDGRPVGAVQTDADAHGEDPARLIEQPAKVMRIGSMIKQLLEEVKAAPLDDASRNRLREIHQRSIVELEDGLAPELREELQRLSLPFGEDATPSEAELRIAQAQLEQMRSGRVALPVGPGGAPNVPGAGHQPADGHGTGQYL